MFDESDRVIAVCLGFSAIVGKSAAVDLVVPEEELAEVLVRMTDEPLSYTNEGN